jgi:hypothetical protein
MLTKKEKTQVLKDMRAYPAGVDDSRYGSSPEFKNANLNNLSREVMSRYG